MDQPNLFLDQRDKDRLLRQLLLLGVPHRVVVLLREVDAISGRDGWTLTPKHVLAARCGCSEPTVRRSVRKAEQMGLLEVLHHTGRESQYRVCWLRIRCFASPIVGSQNDGGQNDPRQNDQGGRQNDHPPRQNDQGPKKAYPRTKLNTSSKYITPPSSPSLKPELENLKPEPTSPPEKDGGGDGGSRGLQPLGATARQGREPLGASAPALEPTAGAEAPKETGLAGRQGREPLGATAPALEPPTVGHQAAAAALEEPPGCPLTPEPGNAPETASEALTRAVGSFRPAGPGATGSFRSGSGTTTGAEAPGRSGSQPAAGPGATGSFRSEATCDLRGCAVREQEQAPAAQETFTPGTSASSQSASRKAHSAGRTSAEAPAQVASRTAQAAPHDPRPKTQDPWSSVTRAVYQAGVAQAHEATARAREHGCDPEEILALVSHYLRHRGCWSPGQLFVRIVQHVPGASHESNWPTPRRPLRAAPTGSPGGAEAPAQGARRTAQADLQDPRPKTQDPPSSRLRRFPRERIQEALARLPPHLRPLGQRRGLGSELVAAWVVQQLEAACDLRPASCAWQESSSPEAESCESSAGAEAPAQAEPQDPRPATQDSFQEDPSHETQKEAFAGSGSLPPPAGPGD